MIAPGCRTRYTCVMTIKFAAAILATALICTAALADPAEVVGVDASVTSGTTWRFDVAIAHPETGWDDYADGWRIETGDGQVLGTRPLAHPHANEQPFTRSLTGVDIPGDVNEIMVRASTSVEGWADTAFGPYPLPR